MSLLDLNATYELGDQFVCCSPVQALQQCDADENRFSVQAPAVGVQVSLYLNVINLEFDVEKSRIGFQSVTTDVLA